MGFHTHFIFIIIFRLSYNQGLGSLLVNEMTFHGNAGYNLNVASLAQYSGYTLIKCAMECLKCEECDSFNYNEIQRTCSISNGTKITNPGNYVADSAVTYFSKWEPGSIQVEPTVAVTSVDCNSIFDGGSTTSGVYTIYPAGLNNTIDVYCDMDTQGGPWIVFQKRFNGSVDFYRSWDEYRDGFGNINGEFWLGNRVIHEITLHGTWELRVDLGDYSDPMERAYAHYDTFTIGNEIENYRLSIGTYNGTAGDSLGWHNGFDFHTYDQDSPDLCAQDCHGAWWYTSCRHSNLNGPWGGPGTSGVNVPAIGTICQELMNWFHFKGSWEAVKTTEMKMRRKPSAVNP